jgi:hypothetical protein
MSDERRDDEILGRALARAIETIDIDETPYESSRVAIRPSRTAFGLVWQLAGIASALVVAVAIGSYFAFGRQAIERAGAPATPAASVGASGTPAPTATPTKTVVPTADDHQLVYFARDGLSPVAQRDDSIIGATADAPAKRIASRMAALFAKNVSAPAGAFTAVPANSPVRAAAAVTIAGDLVTLDFTAPNGDWGVRGAAQSTALLQQLVYTATEEPGIRRAALTQNGGTPVTIDQLVVDKPLTREDVSGYSVTAKPDRIEDGGTDVVADVSDWRASVDDVAPGLARFVVELKPTTTAANPPMPKFSARLESVTSPNDAGKWVIHVELPDAVWQQPRGEAFHCCPLKIVGRTPLREIAAYPLGANPAPVGPGTLGGGAYRGVGFAIALDDARPWRAVVLQNPLRLVIDVGGTPTAVSDSVAVYAPRPADTVDRTFTVSGLARAFEANVVWRIKDRAGRIVSRGNTTASIGTSALWGSFQTSVTIPTSVSGNVTLEVLWPSPRDGADMGLVAIPLVVR